LSGRFGFELFVFPFRGRFGFLPLAFLCAALSASSRSRSR
jgi:hypothetical protein